MDLRLPVGFLKVKVKVKVQIKAIKDYSLILNLNLILKGCLRIVFKDMD